MADVERIDANGDVARTWSELMATRALCARSARGIVVFATHSLGVLPRFCGRTILLSHGRIIAHGPTEEVARLCTDREATVPGGRTEASRC